MFLGACAVSEGGSGRIPEEVAALAGPNQNLATARLMPEDGCYWYLHEGPVETTLLPLRTASGNPICVQRAG
ncbi:hypothetical protein [Cribrihabitans neustonicus]|uniref:hypothetical protein n=1 Tax=Cribrihabitans neustonicus TaxID=1429085 RepID=UPI003B5932E8